MLNVASIYVWSQSNTDPWTVNQKKRSFTACKNPSVMGNSSSDGEMVLIYFFLKFWQIFQRQNSFSEVVFHCQIQDSDLKWLALCLCLCSLSKLKEIQQYSWLPSQFCVNFTFSFSWIGLYYNKLILNEHSSLETFLFHFVKKLF